MTSPTPFFSMLSKLTCPVPKAQRPVNEYLELLQSPFFNWPFHKNLFFRQKLLFRFGLFFLLCFPLSCLFFSPFFFLEKVLLLTTWEAGFLVFLLLLRLFLAWKYVEQRLLQPSIFYEESGWYDGRVWVKPKNILIQDALISTYQVLPSLKSLEKALGGNFFFLLFLGIFLFLT